MKNILECLERVQSVAIGGHVRPDGDCVGSCLGLYNYIKDNYPKIKTVDVYLEPVNDKYSFIQGTDHIRHTCGEDTCYDLFIALDNGDLDRLEPGKPGFLTAKETLNIDHHISNTNYAMTNYVRPDASSACEVVYSLMDQKKVGLKTAEALYTGLISDTGVFRHSCTSQTTLKAAGELISKGINFPKLIDEVFYQKTYIQNQILGRALMESILLLDDKVIYSVITQKELDFYEASATDLEGVIDQLRVTKGVEVAILATELKPLHYKVSMRSNGLVNVNQVAAAYGGGGHNLAAGCTISGTKYDIINNLTQHIEEQLPYVSRNH